MHLERVSPVSPVPILHIHGVDDPRALYGGGEGSRRVTRESIIGPPTTRIAAAEEAWRFASQLSKP